MGGILLFEWNTSRSIFILLYCHIKDLIHTKINRIKVKWVVFLASFKTKKINGTSIRLWFHFTLGKCNKNWLQVQGLALYGSSSVRSLLKWGAAVRQSGFNYTTADCAEGGVLTPVAIHENCRIDDISSLFTRRHAATLESCRSPIARSEGSLLHHRDSILIINFHYLCAKIAFKGHTLNPSCFFLHLSLILGLFEGSWEGVVSVSYHFSV